MCSFKSGWGAVASPFGTRRALRGKQFLLANGWPVNRQLESFVLALPHAEAIVGLCAPVLQAEAARATEADKWRHLTVSTVFEDGRFDSRSHMAKSGINS
jgi:hypothetical protein